MQVKFLQKYTKNACKNEHKNASKIHVEIIIETLTYLPYINLLTTVYFIKQKHLLIFANYKMSLQPYKTVAKIDAKLLAKMHAQMHAKCMQKCTQNARQIQAKMHAK